MRCGTQDRGSELLQHVAGALRSQGVTCQQRAPTSDGLYFVNLALPGALCTLIQSLRCQARAKPSSLVPVDLALPGARSLSLCCHAWLLARRAWCKP